MGEPGMKALAVTVVVLLAAILIVIAFRVELGNPFDCAMYNGPDGPGTVRVCEPLVKP